nr:hypothetical protein 2 - fruit fly (Drosophila melanogaster) retrotransposon mgd1 [Drosophila melanogaster]
MGWFGSDDSQTKDNTANVVNNLKIVDHTDDIQSLWLLLLIMTIVTVAQFILTLYVKHNKIIKRRYIGKAENSLDKI